MKLLLSPYAQVMRNGKRNPKNYPFFSELIKMLEDAGHTIIQIGRKNEEQLVKDFRSDLPLKELRKLLEEVDLFITIDSFLPHMAKHYGKKGIVIFSKSDPLIFGYPENMNVLKDRKHLRERQFDIWETEEYDEKAFIEPKIIFDSISSYINT